MSRRNHAGFLRPGYDPLKVPNAPTIGTATAGNQSVSIAFTAPANVGGSAITGYQVKAVKVSDGTVTNAAGTSSPVSVTGITGGATYTASVVAVNSYGPSMSSGTVSATAGKTPGAPTIGTATATSYSTATIAFSAPADPGYPTSLTYTVTSSPGGITATGSSSPITVSGLSGSTSYTFTVKATNTTGSGSASSSSNSITTPAAPPTTIGQAYGGGYYAGKINDGGTQYYLIVAPKASGEVYGKTWGVYGTMTGITNVVTGPTNTNSLNAIGSSYQAAQYCKGLSIGGYTDWYLPAKNELEVCYYFLKPGTSTNDTSSGSNANAVSPEPISTNYTSGSPAQTSSTLHRTGNSEAFVEGRYWSSSEYNANSAWLQFFFNGLQYDGDKNDTFKYVRAVRRVAV